MAVCIQSAALIGIDALIIQIETRITPGIGYCIVGLPDESVKESLIRVESALSAAGFHMPRQHIVISMAPAGIRKQGALFDLPIALSVLAASGQLDAHKLNSYISVGELSLTGKLRPVRGVLSMALQARKEGFKSMFVPAENSSEAATVEGLAIFGMPDLLTIVDFLSDRTIHQKAVCKPVAEGSGKPLLSNLDLSDIQGQAPVKRAMEIAAAGGHNLLMIGPPGSGKTMLAKRLPTLLPPLSLQESMEITRIYSIVDQLEASGLITTRPFRAPHHTASDISLVGGGMQAMPGEISMAHNGVLFLDELPEFARRVLEVLRQPLEEKRITISRANFNNTYPAGFIFIGAMNPCPCGFFGHPTRKCCCSLTAIRRYLNKISGPLLDRIDLHVKVEPVNFSALSSPIANESSDTVRKRVLAARKKQVHRHKEIINADLTHELLRTNCKLGHNEQEVLMEALQKHQLSARSYERILKVARTIADLASADKIGMVHLSEAIGYRCLDHDYFSA